MRSIKSFLFLLNVFYLKFIPTAFVWNGFAPLIKPEKENYRTIRITLFTISILISYLIALIIYLIPFIFFLNLILIGSGNKDSFLSIYFFLGGITNYSLLVSRLANPKFAKVLGNILLFFSLIILTIGGMEMFNDYSSHVNPDIFDLLLPEYGGKLFWGGAFLLTLSSFILNFLSQSQSIKVWKKREEVAKKLPKYLQTLVFSKSILHPYFFLDTEDRKKERRNLK